MLPSPSFLKRSSLFLLSLALACALLYHLIGSYLDDEGVLHEPFGLIPIGWLALVLGLFAGLLYVVTVWRQGKS